MIWSETLILAAVLTVWSSISNFHKRIKRTNSNLLNVDRSILWPSLKKDLTQLQNLSESVNKLIGHIMGLLVLETIFTQTQIISNYKTWTETKIYDLILEIPYTVTELGIFIYAADIPKKVNWIKISLIKFFSLL